VPEKQDTAKKKVSSEKKTSDRPKKTSKDQSEVKKKVKDEKVMETPIEAELLTNGHAEVEHVEPEVPVPDQKMEPETEEKPPEQVVRPPSAKFKKRTTSARKFIIIF